MYLFKLPVVSKEKEKFHHPWERTVKDVYSNKIKHLHNSVYNPNYPKKERVPPKERVKFTIIGNRVSSEFIYCANLVKGLFKYRWKYFECPVIRGVTGVEWPKVWNDLKVQFGTLAYCLRAEVAVLYNDNFLGGDKELIELVEAKYDYHLSLNYEKESIALFTGFVKSLARPCVYMHIEIDDKYIGTMIFVLYADIVPRTCENFLRLCKEKRGGYSGTPVHRIVKDGWIQGGGIGLKSTDLDCENYNVPFESRGVLSMANDGRNVDCSTQFFVLLQPAPWMRHKYVAFGQLIDGESTLQKIESEPTWYESPKSNIIISQSGILNLDCEDIMINRGANEYIEGHIDNLVVVGELFMELLIQKVYLEIEFKRIQSLQVEPEGDDSEDKKQRAAERLQLKKQEIGKQLEKSVIESHSNTPGVSKAVSRDENQQFDVDEYSYEDNFMQSQTVASASIPIKEKPYYIPLTDVPYPGEIDSTYDLQRFLKGHYCAETDLAVHPVRLVLTRKQQRKLSYISDVFDFFNYADDDTDDDDHDNDMDSEEEAQVTKYLKEHTERVSFAGGIVKSIAKTNQGTFNLMDTVQTPSKLSRKSELITDDMLRKFRLASEDFRRRESRKVSIAPTWDKAVHTEIKRRQTGFRTDDLEAIRIISRRSSIASQSSDSGSDDDDETHPSKVRMKTADDKSHESHFKRRPTAFAFPKDIEALADASMHTEDGEDEGNDDSDDSKEVRISSSAEAAKHEASNFKRRATAYVFPKNLPVIEDDEDDDEDEDDDNKNDDDEDEKQVRMALTTDTKAHDAEVAQFKRRPTAFVRPGSVPIDDPDDDDDDKDADKDDAGEKEKSDDELKVRLASTTDTMAHDAEVAHLKRRPTTFVRPGSIPIDDDDEEANQTDANKKEASDDDQKVRLAPTTDIRAHDAEVAQFKRRPTTFVRPGSIPIDDDDEDDNDEPKVHLATISDTMPHDAEVAQFKRRPTTFVRPGAIPVDDDEDDDHDNYPGGCGDNDDDDDLHVQIAPDQVPDDHARKQSIRRRPTTFVRPADLSDNDHDDDADDDADKENKRVSLLHRMVEDNKQHDYAPTLKNYKPLSELQNNNIFLTQSRQLKSDSTVIKEKAMLRSSMSVDDSIDNVLNIQHGPKFERKMSSDYARTIEQIRHKLDRSLRSVEYARHRPTITVNEYRQKNQKYREEQKMRPSKQMAASSSSNK